MNKNAKIVVFGSKGLVGSAIIRELQREGFSNIVESCRQTLDLMSQACVESFFEKEKPEYVFMAAAKVGGIHANNTYRADFIYQNLAIQNNIFGAAIKYPPKRLLFLGSSCIYPKGCPQPIKEEYLLTDSLEPTNEPYAIAKIAGLKTAEAIRSQYGYEFISVMPTNLYGPNDNYHPENSHVIPGLIARMTEAKKRGDQSFKVWGSGKPKREFLYVDDMAKACIFVMKLDNPPDLLNVGTGEDIEIGELARQVKEAVGFSGELEFDTGKPDGTMRKVMDVSRINKLGWRAETALTKGLLESVRDYNSLVK